MIHPTVALANEVASIRTEIAQHVGVISRELVRDVGIDASSVQRSAAAITQMSHKLNQLFPKISQAKAESAKNGDDADPQVWVSLDRSAYDLRDGVCSWARIEALVREQIPQKRRELMPSWDEITASQMNQYDAVFDQLHELFAPQSQSTDARDYGCFADITLPNSTFIAYAHAARRVLLAKQPLKPSRFLDVGCGTGFKVMMAAKYFDRCDGLEYDPAYAEGAKSFFDRAHLQTCRAFQADGMEYTEYDDYDVIYFYRPMREDDQLRLLETQILKHTRPGTLIIAPYKVFESRFKDYGCARICGWLYITETSPSDAEILLKKAELTGAFIGKVPQHGRGVLDPILTASATKGFGL